MVIALRVPDGRRSQISRQWAYEGGKIVSPTHLPPLPLGDTLVPLLLEAESTPGPECGRIMSMKNSSDCIGHRTRDLPTYDAVCAAACSHVFMALYLNTRTNLSLYIDSVPKFATTRPCSMAFALHSIRNGRLIMVTTTDIRPVEATTNRSANSRSERVSWPTWPS